MPYTVSLAVPGSVIENTQTLELATAVAGLIARTAAIFCVDEVVVIDDAPHIRCPCWCHLLIIPASWVLACVAIFNIKQVPLTDRRGEVSRQYGLCYFGCCSAKPCNSQGFAHHIA